MQHGPSGVDAASTVTPMDLAVLKEQIERGEYRVDPTAVADALLRRLRAFAQNECSYPDSGPSAPANTTPGGPSTTDPIQVMFASLFWLGGGRQAHSS
jgi:anti-sigma-28 factor FlgM